MTDLERALQPLVARLVADELAKQRPAPSNALTVDAYAARYSISASTVRLAIREQRLEVVRIGRSVRIPANATISKRASKATQRARLSLLGGGR